MAIWASVVPAAKPDKQQPASLYECSYNLKCKHVWVTIKDYTKVHCPKCSASSVALVANYIHPSLNFERLSVVTFAGQRTISFKTYKKDSLLKVLIANGFALEKNGDYGYEEFNMTNALHEKAIFKFSKNRKTSNLYLGLHDKNSDLMAKLVECAHKDKANKIKEPPPPPKPTFETISDSVGQEIRVGDWVVCWSTKSLGFGRVENIGEFMDYRTKLRGARIRAKNKILLPFKTSEQLFKMTEERAMLLMLEG